MSHWENLKVNIALWLVVRLLKFVFPVIDMYTPGSDSDEDAPVKAIIIADSEETLNRILTGQTFGE